jgi:hypothetical protein
MDSDMAMRLAALAHVFQMVWRPATWRPRPSPPRHVALSWARRLKRVFGVQIESCTRCGGPLKIIASIEEAQLIAKILSHLERAVAQQSQSELPLVARGPPEQSSLL